MKTEMEKLIELLEFNEIPFDVNVHFLGPQVCYPSKERCICDAICGAGTYGGDEGLLEIMGLVDEEEIGDSVEGYLTADEVFTRILKHYLYKAD